MPQSSLGSIRLVSCLACFTMFACAGGAPPKTAAAPHEDPPPSKTANASGTTKAASEHAAAAPSESPEAAPADPVITRTLSERVFAPRIAFMLNYPISGAKDAADRKCTVKFPAPEAKAACMDKEREKFTADVLVFEKSDKGTSFTVYKRSGNALVEMSRAKIALGADTTEMLAVKVEKEKGWRPIFAGKKEFSLQSRDEYSIQVDEPQYGRLVYEARIGILD